VGFCFCVFVFLCLLLFVVWLLFLCFFFLFFVFATLPPFSCVFLCPPLHHNQKVPFRFNCTHPRGLAFFTPPPDLYYAPPQAGDFPRLFLRVSFFFLEPWPIRKELCLAVTHFSPLKLDAPLETFLSPVTERLHLFFTLDLPNSLLSLLPLSPPIAGMSPLIEGRFKPSGSPCLVSFLSFLLTYSEVWLGDILFMKRDFFPLSPSFLSPSLLPSPLFSPNQFLPSSQRSEWFFPCPFTIYKIYARVRPRSFFDDKSHRMLPFLTSFSPRPFLCGPLFPSLSSILSDDRDARAHRNLCPNFLQAVPILQTGWNSWISLSGGTFSPNLSFLILLFPSPFSMNCY